MLNAVRENGGLIVRYRSSLLNRGLFIVVKIYQSSFEVVLIHIPSEHVNSKNCFVTWNTSSLAGFSRSLGCHPHGAKQSAVAPPPRSSKQSCSTLATGR